jgi:hypothetical protein
MDRDGVSIGINKREGATKGAIKKPLDDGNAMSFKRGT